MRVGNSFNGLKRELDTRQPRLQNKAMQQRTFIVLSGFILIVFGAVFFTFRAPAEPQIGKVDVQPPPRHQNAEPTVPPASDRPAPAPAPAPAAPLEGKAIWLKVQVSAGVFSLVDESFVADSPPNYFPGKRDFIAKVFSNGGALLGEYGINDPRRIVAEPGYQGPTWLDSATFQLIVPYFANGARLDLIESATGNVKLSVDISQYATTTD